MSDAEKADAVATLACAPPTPWHCSTRWNGEKVDRRDLSAFTARQLLALNDKVLTEKLTKVWAPCQAAGQVGQIEPLPVGGAARGALKKADRAHGRQVFTKTCATCHTLFGEGAKIGPDGIGQALHARIAASTLIGSRIGGGGASALTPVGSPCRS